MLFFHVFIAEYFYFDISIDYYRFFQIFGLRFLVVVPDANSSLERFFQLNVVIC